MASNVRGSEMIKLYVDFNDLHMSPRRTLECHTPWIESVELRQEVILVDHDGHEIPGMVCGIVDYGRGKLIIVEVEPPEIVP
jgi:hypothetical protein